MDHGSQVGGRAGQENLVGQVQLAAVDGPFHDLQAELGLGNLYDGVPGDAGQNVVFQDRGDQPAVIHQEDVLAGPFAYVAVLVEDDSLVEPGQGGFGFSQNAVDVDTANLEACRNHGIVHPPPRRSAAPQSVGAQVIAEGNGDEGEIAAQLLELEVGHHFGALVSQRSDVYILLMAVALHQFHGDIAELFYGVRDVEHQQAAAPEQSLVMLPEPEDENRSLFLVPITPNPFEHAGPIVQGVGHNVHVGVGQRDIPAPEECAKIAGAVGRRLGSAQDMTSFAQNSSKL